MNARQHGLEVIKRQVNETLREVISVACPRREESRTIAALLTLMTYIANSWTCITIMHSASSTKKLREVTANSCAAVFRCLYDALLQMLYIANSPKVADERARSYLEFGAVEHHEFLQTIIGGKTALARRLAASPLRPKAEPRIREEFEKVRRRYEGKRGRIRKHWYPGTLRDIAEQVGKGEEYSWYVGMLSSSVHAGSFAALRGPLPLAGDEFIVWAATAACQAAEFFVDVGKLAISSRGTRALKLYGIDLLNTEGRIQL